MGICWIGLVFGVNFGLVKCMMAFGWLVNVVMISLGLGRLVLEFWLLSSFYIIY